MATTTDYLESWLAARDALRQSLTGAELLDQLEDVSEPLAHLLRQPEPSAVTVGRLVIGAVNARLSRRATAELEAA